MSPLGMRTNYFRALKAAAIACSIACCTSGLAQTVPVTQNALANRDVVTLAKAGFNEDFIIEAIQASRTQFDTSVKGLSELAHEGLTERLIRVMMNAQVPAPVAVAAPAYGAPTPDVNQKIYMVKPSAAMAAVTSQTPYYQWSSFFWGLYKRKIGVGVAPHPAQAIGSQLGTAYPQFRTAGPYLPPLTSGPAYLTIAAR